MNHEEVLAVLSDSKEEAKIDKGDSPGNGTGGLLLYRLSEGRAAIGRGLGSSD
jgi:hypothetical protein